MLAIGPAIIQAQSVQVGIGFTLPEQDLTVPCMHHTWVPEKLFLIASYSSVGQADVYAPIHTVAQTP